MQRKRLDPNALYVYVYTDPRDGKPFYIGKGQGNRLFTHLDDPAETEKTNKISDIRKSGLEHKRVKIVGTAV